MYCCDPLQAAVYEAGKKGISVIAHADDGVRFFCLQARACDYEDEEEVKSMPASYGPIPLVLRIVSQIVIHFCPFCGTRLDGIIAEHQDEFDALAKSHERNLLN